MPAPEIRSGTLTPEELALVTRPINGNGGMQSLLRTILRKVNHDTGAFTILPQHLERARHYAVYCSGGYEQRFLAIVNAVDRTLAGATPA